MFTKKELKALRSVKLTPQYLNSSDGIKASKEGAEKALKQAKENYR